MFLYFSFLEIMLKIEASIPPELKKIIVYILVITSSYPLDMIIVQNRIVKKPGLNL